MTILAIIVWILIISFATIFGSWYAKRYNRPDALFALYVAFVAFSNIAAVKIAQFDLGFHTFYAPAAALVFPVTFLLTDIVNEKFGRTETHRMIFLAFGTQLVIAVFAYLSLTLPSAPTWTHQDAYQVILGHVPRIMVASWIAFLISENLDAYIFSWFKKLTQGEHLWARNVFSSFPAMFVDSALFATIGFLGISPLWPLVLGLTVTKWLVGLVDIPFMYLNRWIMK
jgi:queuosine precursor transporter